MNGEICPVIRRDAVWMRDQMGIGVPRHEGGSHAPGQAQIGTDQRRKDAVGRVVLVGVVAAEYDVPIITDDVLELGADAILIERIKSLTRVQNVEEAIVDSVDPGNAARESVRDTSRDVGGSLRISEVAGHYVGVRCERLTRVAGNDVDRTPRRIASIERALRALQHLDASDVAELLHQ